MPQPASLEALLEYLKPVPVPDGFTSREIVRRAIEFDGPPRLPFSFIDPLESDFVEISVAAGVSGAIPASIPWGEMVHDDWGVGWKGTGRFVPHSTVHPLADLSAVESYEFPKVLSPEVAGGIEMLVDAGNAAGKYVVGFDLVGNYERLRALIGFEDMMIALHEDRERFEALLDRLTDMTLDVVSAYREMGSVHGFMTNEDWGLQNALQIRPELWRSIFKPRYAKIVEAAHAAGMHYIWHCCGWIVDIIQDMIEIGVDVVQLDQPRLMGHELLTERFGGRICFWNMVDIQWSSRPEVTVEEIRADVQDMVARYARFGGGLMARQYPAPDDIDLGADKHRAIYEAFMELGCGPRGLPGVN